MSDAVDTMTGVRMSPENARIQPVIERTFTDCMEQLQEGYVLAVAATAGCTVQPQRRDLFGADLLVMRDGATPGTEEVSVYLQLKNTTQIRPDLSKETFSYQLKKRVYFDKLAMRREKIKVLLVVMATSPVQADWSKGSHDSLSVQYCCYWRSLEGETAPHGVASPTVKIPTKNVFDADALTEILDKIDRGESSL
ncbi:DUF4365 domain-containing protein [Amycolatopsis kentuckyensis]|uniref:DUF4365 domain-containing protein n=1 Tax=Amycolatopsis kentuckyensis TaxID=218823 RepID=UPI00356AC0FF